MKILMMTHDRSRLERALALALSVGLSACGGGGESSGAAAAVVAPASSTSGSTCGLSGFQTTVVARVNQYRAAGATCGSHGAFPAAPALTWNALLTQAAEGHSQDMVANNFFAHDSFDGRTFDQRITATGYNWTLVAENIAAGQTTIDQVMAGWMASEGHCVNIMNAAIAEIGVVCVSGSSSNTYPTYWTMDLGKSR